MQELLNHELHKNVGQDVPSFKPVRDMSTPIGMLAMACSPRFISSLLNEIWDFQQFEPQQIFVHPQDSTPQSEINHSSELNR